MKDPPAAPSPLLAKTFPPIRFHRKTLKRTKLHRTPLPSIGRQYEDSMFRFHVIKHFLFLLLEIYFCDYFFQQVHSYIYNISCPCDFCGCCLKMHICFGPFCALIPTMHIEGLYILISVNCNKEKCHLSPD